ncbi:hypothetical protein F4561_003637 [Lipingzhangella halophila]|uniref:Alpha/beta hydrolase family protein n=1 Tax=Lipingzhangella halophila TaxID=1783352 RepID=A0A7W7W395_9ACTN|nr:hypothetical protein [Lipingzhangella halophila]MBB4932817.1 hypothetical protein [Lipingzhangella halophila]
MATAPPVTAAAVTAITAMTAHLSGSRPDVSPLTCSPLLAVVSRLPHIVVGVGEDSGGELCDRASRALAAELGVEPALLPGGHVGFPEDPEAFATRLRQVLAAG